MAEKHESLAAALAAFQASLPHIGKGNTAEVRSDKGNYSYKYADLSDVSAVVLPLLARHGLSFSCKPTLTDDGRFVLAYLLRHESGGDDAGIYPLPTSGSPQAIGSAISYARRYVLSAITGVAPDEDDDGAAAQASYEHRQQRPARPPKPAQKADPAPPVAREALEELAAVCTAMSYDRDLVAALYAAEHDGANLRQATDAASVRAFIEHLDSVDPTRIKAPAAATNGAAT